MDDLIFVLKNVIIILGLFTICVGIAGKISGIYYNISTKVAIFEFSQNTMMTLLVIATLLWILLSIHEYSNLNKK
jgi:hypothetical protein